VALILFVICKSFSGSDSVDLFFAVLGKRLLVGLNERKTSHYSVWFFVGLLLLTYGA